MTIQITYDKEKQAIRADGKNLIDFSAVKDGAQAILYSRRGSEQDQGFEKIFRFVDNELFPFCLGFASLTPASFIRTMVENGLQIDGLKCSGEIAEAYRVVKNKRLPVF